MFFYLFFLGLFGVSQIGGLWLPVTIKDCPNIPQQKGINIDNFLGPWRLAYVFIDDNYEEINEDDTCAVAEIVQVNETKLALLMMIDEKTNDFTIDRYTKEFDLTILSPGEWLLHTPFQNLQFIHITVINLSHDHLILTFCVIPYTPEESTPKNFSDQVGDYDSYLKALERNSIRNIFKSQSFDNMFKDFDDLNEWGQKQRRLRQPSRLLKGKRNVETEKEYNEESIKAKLNKYLSKHTTVTKKHLWTAILVKNNNVSALKFIENASLLMKYGFDITQGQLVSFSGCNLAKK